MILILSSPKYKNIKCLKNLKNMLDRLWFYSNKHKCEHAHLRVANINDVIGLSDISWIVPGCFAQEILGLIIQNN